MAIRSDSLNLISICTGGGGLDLGFELAIPNARSVCMVEREAFGCAQLVSAMEAGYLAPAPIWSDARTFDGRAWRGAVDGLIGGIPCQPHSLAGKRLEREDPRDLWSTARRIIVQSGAWFVLIENVRGMLTSGGAERVWRDLGRLGFACELGLFSAAEVGATHERERFFLLAVADTNVSELRRQSPTGELAQLQRNNAVGLFPPGPSDVNGWREVLERAPELEPAVRRMADGLASRVDRLRMLGNGVVPLEAAYAVRTLATRLSARGSAGAGELVRMMEAGDV